MTTAMYRKWLRDLGAAKCSYRVLAGQKLRVIHMRQRHTLTWTSSFICARSPDPHKPSWKQMDLMWCCKQVSLVLFTSCSWRCCVFCGGGHVYLRLSYSRLSYRSVLEEAVSLQHEPLFTQAPAIHHI